MKRKLLVGLTSIAVLAASVPVLANDSFIMKSMGIRNNIVFVSETDSENGMIKTAKLSAPDFSWAVEKDLISQQTADEIAAFVKADAEKMKEEMESLRDNLAEKNEAGVTRIAKDLFTELITAGILTEDEASALKAEMPEQKGEMSFICGPQNVHFVMSDFSWAVEKGLLSQETADAASEYLKADAEKMKEEMEAVESMGEEERKAFFDGKKETHKDALSELVTVGILTQDEADALKAERPLHNNKFFVTRGMNFEALFEALVEDGVITQSKADEINAYLEKKSELRTVEIAIPSSEDINDNDSNVNFAKTIRINGDVNKVNIFDELIENGIITADEAEAIKAAMPERINIRTVK